MKKFVLFITLCLITGTAITYAQSTKDNKKGSKTLGQVDDFQKWLANAASMIRK